MANFFDLFSGDIQRKAADEEIAGLRAGLTKYGDLAGQGREALTTNYTAALQPWMTFQGGAQRGMDAWGDATGANGPEGLARAQRNFEAMGQPGIEKAVDVVGRGGVARGVATGNILDEQTRVAADRWAQLRGNYTAGLQPYGALGATGAGGISGVYGNLGTGLAGSYGNQATAAMGTERGIGAAQAQGTLGELTGLQNLAGLGMAGLTAATGGLGGGFGGVASGLGGGLLGGLTKATGTQQSPLFGFAQQFPSTWSPAPRY